MTPDDIAADRAVMTTDPRVEAVAEALWGHRKPEVFYADIWKNYGCECGWSSELDDADSLREHQAAAAVAALDAFDNSGDGLTIYRRQVREWAARALDAEADRLDALTITNQDWTAITVLQIKREATIAAARIVRGQG